MHEEIQEIDESEISVSTDAPADREGEKGYFYTEYTALGGQLNEENYMHVMKEAEEAAQAGLPGSFVESQTKITAAISGVSLDAIRDETGIDPRYIYDILRHGTVPLPYAHLSDQHLLVESLHMLGQESAVQAIIDRHPHIDFN